MAPLRGRPTRRSRGEGSALALLFRSVVSDHAFLRIPWSNFSEVIPGRLYRSNHLMPGRLASIVRRHGIRTVVNLRGDKPNGSTELSAAAAARLGVTNLYLPFESRGAPHRDRVLRFFEIYQTWAEPALVHCKSGADRAGLAAGLVILFEGGTAAQALAQLSLRHLHFNHSKTGILDAFFARYARDAEGRLPFLDWVRHEYDEDALRRSFVPSGLSSFINDRVLLRE